MSFPRGFSTRVNLDYDSLKINRKIRNCAKYIHSASQSAKSGAAAVLQPHKLLLSLGSRQLPKTKSFISGTFLEVFGILERNVNAARGDVLTRVVRACPGTCNNCKGHGFMHHGSRACPAHVRPIKKLV